MEEKENKINITLIASLAFSLFSFIGLLISFVNYHPVEYDPVNWAFSEAGSRVALKFGDFISTSWPFIILYSLVAISVILLAISIKYRKVGTIAIVLLLLCGTMFLLSNSFFAYAKALASFNVYAEDVGNEYKFWFIQNYILVADSRLEVGAILASVFCFLGGLTAFVNYFSKESIDVKEMVEMAILVATAIVIDVIVHFIPNIPGQVGSVSFATLPLFIIALRHGPVKGFLCASFIYGLITCLTDGYGIWLYILDYFVAFSGVAIIGFFKKQILENGKDTYNLKGILLIILSVVLAGFVRLIGSGASSILNYNYTFGAALTVNSLYIGLSAVITGAMLVALYRPLLVINKRYPAGR